MENKNKYVVYLRVSTVKQGASGLGLDAQKKMCKDFIEHAQGECVATFEDIESGTHRDRKGLWNAIDFCKKNNCGLVIAKLDRLARDVEFTFKVMNTGIDIHFTDMPVVNTMILGVFAAVAQYERELTSDRTKKALAQKKAQGAKLGASNEKWQANYKKKSAAEKKAIGHKRGDTKNARYLADKETQVFLRIIKRVYGFDEEDPTKWNWLLVKTKKQSRDAIRMMMQDYRELNGLFDKWTLEVNNKEEDVMFQRKLSCHIANVRKAVFHK